jgi:hypothetical protein
MRVCYFYAESFPRAVRALPANVEMVDTSGSDTAYWEALLARWNSGDDLITIEQDNLIDDQVISSFANCTEIWCSFAYLLGPVVKNLITELVVPWGILRVPGDSGLPPSQQLGTPKNIFAAGVPQPDVAQCSASLGCTKYSKEMQAQVRLEDALPFFNKHCVRCIALKGKALCWTHIDGPILDVFIAAGINRPHIHGEVEHLHFMGLDARLLFLLRTAPGCG